MTSRRSIGLGDSEPRLLREGVPPGKLPESVTDKEIDKLATDPAKVAPPGRPGEPRLLPPPAGAVPQLA